MSFHLESIAIGFVAAMPIVFLVGLPVRMISVVKSHGHEVCLSPYYVAPFMALAFVLAVGAYLFLWEPWYGLAGLVAGVIIGQGGFEAVVLPQVLSALRGWKRTVGAT